VFGPSLNEVGESLRRLTQRKLDNVGRVVQKANRKSRGQKSDSGPDLRAAEAILREAMVAESEIVADYLGGVLASARSGGGDDAVAWTALIARMSSKELRLHYMIYSAIRREALGHTEINILDHPGRERLRILIPYVGNPGLYQALGNSMEAATAPLTATGLERERLFEQNWRFGPDVGTPRPEFEGGGFELAPSFNGMNLYMWGHGMGAWGISQFLHDEPLEPLPDISVPQAYLATPFPPPEVAPPPDDADGEG